MGMSGCATPERTAEKFGKTFYLDGAGNWGFGASTVPSGLRDAGYRGDVEIYVWTTSLNPLIDQLNIPGAKLRAIALADRIKDYRRRFPDNELNIIALSAGTGVAVWAVEQLDAGTKIKNLVLLGSSLSHDYDASRALANMTGRIFTYHSEHDLILGGVNVIGTIDGKRGVESAGSVGLKTPTGMPGRVVNVAWTPRFIPSGWTGSHTDCTSKGFIQGFVARHVLSRHDVVRTGAASNGRAEHSRLAFGSD